MDTAQHGFIVVDSPRGNDATGQRDSWSSPFATVSKAFQAIQDYDTVFIYPGPYMEQPLEPLDIANLAGGGAPLWLNNRRCVTLKGVGLPTIWFTQQGNGLTIENCSDIRIEGIQFRGAGLVTQSEPYYFALILCNGVNDGITVRDCVFTESGNHGIAHLLGPRTTTNCVIENNHFSVGGNMKNPLLGLDGAAIALGGSGIRIYGNRIERWVRGVEFESGSFAGLNAPTVQNVLSSNRILQCWWQHVTITPTHNQAALFDKIIVEGNIIQGWGAQPAQNFDPTSTYPHDGIYFAGGVNVQIRGNDISDMWSGIGIRMSADWSDIQDALVVDNRVRDVDLTGIHAVATTGATSSFNVKRCRFANNKIGPCGGRGLWVKGDLNIVESNDIHLCTSTQLWEGLYVEGGSRNVLRNNRLIDCLPITDHGTQTTLVGNDLVWDTKLPPR
jgi:hypothetical protein